MTAGSFGMGFSHLHQEQQAALERLASIQPGDVVSIPGYLEPSIVVGVQPFDTRSVPMVAEQPEASLWIPGVTIAIPTGCGVRCVNVSVKNGWWRLFGIGLQSHTQDTLVRISPLEGEPWEVRLINRWYK